jgi:hypothetical protein
MAGFTGAPPIVTDGLIFAVDAANYESYTSGSTTWSDLTGNNNGTLINGPTFDLGNGGSIVFDGTNDYVATSVSRNDSNNEDYTITLWFKIASFTSDDMRLGGATSGNTTQFAFGFSETQLRLWLNTSWNNTSINFTTNTLYNLQIAHSGTDTLTYVNDTLSSTITSKSSYFDNFGLCNPFVLNWGSYFEGNVYNASIYNRALSSTEILQNYNALKSRFNL